MRITKFQSLIPSTLIGPREYNSWNWDTVVPPVIDDYEFYEIMRDNNLTDSKYYYIVSHVRATTPDEARL